MENRELPAEMLTAVTHEILRQKVMGFVDAQGVLEVAGVPGMIRERDEARAALAECEDKLDDIINCMGGDECSGWDAPEDVWEIAQKGRTIARRVLGSKEEA